MNGNIFNSEKGLYDPKKYKGRVKKNVIKAVFKQY